jgi:hypothetical protein
MSCCVYFVEENGLPCGNRCGNSKGYCEIHTKLRPAGCQEEDDEYEQVAKKKGDREDLITTTLPENTDGVHRQDEKDRKDWRAICHQIFFIGPSKQDEQDMEEVQYNEHGQEE